MAIPVYDHVVIVAMENSSFSQIIGNTAGAPYINSLANAGANFTNMHAITHPSFGNYFAVFTGQILGSGDTCPPPGQPYNVSNLGQSLIAAGKTFGGFAENYPGAGICSSGNYLARHVPSLWYTNLSTSLTKDFSTFPTTPTGFAGLPTVSFVTPNVQDDMHTGSITAGDTWLNNNLSAYATWALTHNSLLIVWWDEDNTNNLTPNQVPTIFYGAHVTPGNYNENINHYNILSTLETMYGATLSGAASTATPITDVWTPAVPQYDHIVICVMENHGNNQIIGNTTSAPYINNTLLPKSAFLSQCFSIKHPSSVSYLHMFSGSNQGFTTPPDPCPQPNAPYNAPNLASNLIAAGKTFAEYAQSIPTNPHDCTSAVYDPNHVPCIQFANLPGTPPGTALLKNFSTFPTTPAGFAALPSVSWITPDGNNSMESSSTLQSAIVQGDNFLKNNIDAYATWAQANNSLLIITWDEDQGFLNGNGGSPTGGGQVVTLFIGAKVIPGTYPEASITASVGVAGVDHYNVLRTVEDSFSIAHAGAAATATPITDVFSSAPIVSSIQLLQRVADGTEGSSFTVTASAPSIFDAIIATVTGENPGSPNDPPIVNSGAVNASSTTVNVPGITTTVPGDILIWYGFSSALAQGTGTTSVPPPITLPTGFTKSANQVNSTGVNANNTGVLGGYKTQLTAGSTGSLDGTITSAQINGGLLVGITASGSSGNTLGPPAAVQVLFPINAPDIPDQPAISVSPGVANVSVVAVPGSFTNISGLAINGPPANVVVGAFSGGVNIPFNLESAVLEAQWDTTATFGTQMNSAWAIDAQATGVTQQITWDTSAFVSAFMPSTWATVGPLPSTLESTWTTFSINSSQKRLSWNDLIRTNSQKAVGWKIKKGVSATIVSRWNIVGRLSAKKRMTWHDGGRTSAKKKMVWKTLDIRVNSTQPVAWNDYQIAKPSVVIQWATIGRKSSKKKCVWKTKLAVVDQKAVAWNIRNKVTASMPTGWTTFKKIKPKKRITWNTLTRNVDL